MFLEDCSGYPFCIGRHGRRILALILCLCLETRRAINKKPRPTVDNKCRSRQKDGASLFFSNASEWPFIESQESGLPRYCSL